MPKGPATLDRVFHALANGTRRQIVEDLTAGPASMTSLATKTEMALPSFLQHLNLLEETGLVRSQKVGRVRTYELNPPIAGLAEDWLTEVRNRWNARLDRLDAFLLDMNQESENE